MNIYEPELGQMAFGNTWETFEAPDFVRKGLDFLGQIISKDNKEQNPSYNTGVEFVNGVFEMRSHYWGECTCGWDSKEFDGEHQNGCYQIELDRMEKDRGVHFSQHDPNLGYKQSKTIREGIYNFLTHKYNLPMKGCAVHCTCDYKKRYEQWFEVNKIGPYGHADNCKVQQPNFKYGDFEAKWYKHLGRGTTCNREIAPEEFSEILQVCLKSIKLVLRRDGRIW